jgi:coenzyme F420-reducing hydrogenase alpha subunit
MAVTDGQAQQHHDGVPLGAHDRDCCTREKIRELLNDPDLQGTDLVVAKGERRDEETVGLIEAPRGTLFHHYKVNEHDQVTMAT